ncbi:CapA family protein [Vibrio cyclitrophicus]|nr:CapA family protein [Vibrio cyclitrophicus]UPR33120.1 CapA family protein [Vibrio cyclitrophicus]
MIFVGDVAISDSGYIEFVDFPSSIKNMHWSINLEGPIMNDGFSSEKGVYNSPVLFDIFESFNLRSASLANNHILDFHDGINRTVNILSEKNIDSFGAGSNVYDAARPYFNDDEKICVISYGWTVIGCSPASVNSSGVNSFDALAVIKQARELVRDYPEHKVVVIIHGNYEFELYPQPADRQLSHKLIDIGVYSVLFHHPHVVSPIEIYNNRCICYSLGNWAFSYGKFFGGNLKFPNSSFNQVAIEISDSDIIVHHASFDGECRVVYDGSESVFNDDFSMKAKFQGFSDSQYLSWFKKNRRKKLLLPIYKNYHNLRKNRFKSILVGGREYAIKLLLSLGLKSQKRKD